MKNLKIWLVVILVFLIVGLGLGLGLKIGFFGYIIGAFCALLVAILMFKKKTDAQNVEKVVYDEDNIYQRRLPLEDEEDK